MKLLNVLVALLLIDVVGCTTLSQREHPTLVEKNYSPVKGGVIEHQKPSDRYEEKQFKLASIEIMKKFCQRPYQVLSEKNVSEAVEFSTSRQLSPGDSTYTSKDVRTKVRINFECSPSVPENPAH